MFDVSGKPASEGSGTVGALSLAVGEVVGSLGVVDPGPEGDEDEIWVAFSCGLGPWECRGW